MTLDLDGTYFWRVDDPSEVPVLELEKKMEIYGDFEVYIVTGRPESEREAIKKKVDLNLKDENIFCYPFDYLQGDVSEEEGKDQWRDINRWKIRVIDWLIKPNLVLENERGLAMRLKKLGYKVVCVNPVDDPLVESLKGDEGVGT